MKRGISLLLLLSLTSCGEQPESQAQNEANAKFAAASKLWEEGVSGTIHEGGTEETRFKGDLNEYRQGKLDKAAPTLEALANDPAGRAAQKASAGVALAEIHASRARLLTNQAIADWTLQAGLANELPSLASTVRFMHTLADARGKLDFSKVMEAYRAQHGKARQEVEGQTAVVKALTDAMAADEATNKDHLAKKQAAIEKSSQLSQQAFTLKGEKRHEAEVASNDSRLEAEKHDAQMDKLAARMKLRQDELAIEKERLSHLNRMVEVIDGQIADLQKKDKTNKDASAATLGETSKVGQTVVQLFKEMAASQAKVDKQMVDAAAQMDKAIEAIDKAKASAQATAKDSVDGERLAFMTEKGLVLYQHYVMLNSYHGRIANLVEGVGPALGADVQQVTDAAKDAADRVAKLRTAAQQVLAAVAPEFTELTERSPNDEARRANTLHMINVHDLLSEVSEDREGNKAKADSYRQTLNSLKPPAEETK